MIKDNIITIRYRPKAKLRYCFKYEYWRNGRVSKSMCDSHLSCETDHILGVWGDKFSGKTLYWNVSSYVAKIFQRCCHHAYYVSQAKDFGDKMIKHHKESLAVLSVVYDIFLDFLKSRSSQLFGNENDLYILFKIHHEISKLHDESMKKYYKDDGKTDLVEFHVRDILFNIMCEITRIRINDYEIVKDFKKITIKEWENGTYPKKPN